MVGPIANESTKTKVKGKDALLKTIKQMLLKIVMLL
jgi:hypothetical protein